MKSLAMILATGLFFSFNAMAEKLRMTCITTQPTTTYQIYERDEDYKLIIFHHHGVKYMPIYTGTITPNDLDFLQAQASKLQKLGYRSEVFFKKSECDVKGVLWTCYKKDTVMVGGLKADGVSFMMNKKKTIFAEQYEWTTIETYMSFGEKKGAVMTSIDMRYSYSDGDCVQEDI